METYDTYHVDPATTRHDTTGRHPRNFVQFSPFLAPIEWIAAISKALHGKPFPRLGNSLIDAFDRVGPLDARWGTATELDAIRRNIRLFSQRVDENDRISPTGRFLLKMMMQGHLRNRAETIAYYETHRGFIEAHGRYRAPVIVTGFPRTGTTLLQRLLSEDPNTRSPYSFEFEKSTPPLRAGADPLKDERIEKSAATMTTFRKLAPGFLEKFAESHLWSATEKEESLSYMQFHCGLNMMNGIAAGRTYYRSMFQPDVADALFKYERNFFTMLDAYAPCKTHWTNKAPVYAPYLGKLFEYLPDARVVITHRHPGKNMASVCRLFESWLVPFDVNGSFDKVRMSGIARELTHLVFSVPLAYRTAHPERESQIMDCEYQDLFRDPIAMVKRIYEKFDIECSPVFEERMKIYLESNKQGKYGRHKYTNEEYGIDRHQLYQDNRAYYEKHGYGPDPEGHD